jgi:hypothetical protein
VCFDLFEERFDTPPAFIKFFNGRCCPSKIVGKEFDVHLFAFIPYLNHSDLIGIVLFRLRWSGKTGLEKSQINPKLHTNMKRERRKFTNEFKAEVA